MKEWNRLEEARIHLEEWGRARVVPNGIRCPQTL